MDKQIEEILKENTWASIKLKDVPEKLRFTLMKIVKAEDMIDKQTITKIIESIDKRINKIEKGIK